MAGEGINYDNLIVRGLNRIGDAMILSLLTVLFSIPIITAGASLTAGYYTAMHGVAKDDGYVWKKFIKSFKQNFKQSTIMWLIFMLLFIVFGVDVWYWQTMYENKTGGFMAQPLLVVSVVLFALTVMTFIFAFPLQAKFDNTVKVQIKNAFLLSIRYVPTTIGIVFTMTAVALIFKFQPLLAIVFFVLIGFGILLYFFAFLMLRCFQVFLQPEGTVQAEEVAETKEPVQTGEKAKSVVKKEIEDEKTEDE
ncbi:MAG: DUF624 domain-containing protein [Lachnospiraceae bacterium]|nr:DUF624 domain-containing protein [Lachnospiraceae bacterium]